MKKIISIITILIVLTAIIFTNNSYAATLDTINIEIDKTTITPGENVTVSIKFGENLGAYTFDIAYDNNIFEFVSADGGTANDTTDKIKVTYFDTTGGSSPRNNMSVTFKAKSDITTSNPTEFTVTAEGLANADATVTFDDITTPIVKNVVVEPQFVEYTLKFEHSEKVIKGQENEMKLSIYSLMGKYYEHARLVVDVTPTEGGNVKLLATDEQKLEHDLVQSGWGDAQGFKIGGPNYSQVLNLRGIFDKTGNYIITFKLIDRDDSDKEITRNTYQVTVVDSTTTPETPNSSNTQQTNPENPTTTQNQNTVTPTKLPKTGTNIYIPVIFIIISLISSYIYFNKRK